MVSVGAKQNIKVGQWKQAFGPIWPFDEFQTRRREEIAQASVFPLLRVLQAVKIAMVNRQAGERIGLNERVGGAFHAAVKAQRPQQVACERRLAGAQRALQGDEGLAQCGLACPGLRQFSEIAFGLGEVGVGF